MAGPSKYAHLLVDLACVQDDVEEQYADINSEEELKDTTLQDPSSAEENDEDLEWHHQLPSDKADVHQFVGEQSGLNKTAAPNITENSQSRDFFLLYFHTILVVIVQETTDICNKRHKQEINQILHILRKCISCSYSSDASQPQAQYDTVLDRRLTLPRSFLLHCGAT
jgi:hypothetical protein